MYKYYMYVVYTNNIYIMYFNYIDKLVNRTGSIDNYFKKKELDKLCTWYHSNCDVEKQI